MTSASQSLPSVLICGGGIAGNAVALQLTRAGFRVTVVERAPAPRPGGQAVDLRGPSRDVAERMGLMPGIRDHQLDERGMVFVGDDGRELLRMPAEMFGGNGVVADIEITRGDLNQVLLDAIGAAGGELDYRYDEWVKDLRQQPSGVEVTFASGAGARFDLVVGADGVHSATRRLVFGAEDEFATYLGGYMSFFTVPTPAGIDPHWFAMHSVPGASNVGLRADFDPATSKAVVMIRMPADPALRRDTDAQQTLIRERLAEAGWEAPAILDAMAVTPDFYFDELARIDMPSWSEGRVTLLGDAGYCGSPLSGQGTAMALVGAYVLAGELAATPDDPARALARYEEVLRPFVAEAQKLAPGGLRSMTPKSRLGIRAGRMVSKLMMSRLMQPVMAKAMAKTESYSLPEYASAPVTE
ncbi:FAD-dependent oxidoreductase [Rhodococcus oryzae]|uniref:FAD-dependent oxidoreductase n=1 Tax=Rhodococcus oryzae TaxID=2571143 RepID=UPI00378CCC5E